MDFKQILKIGVILSLVLFVISPMYAQNLKIGYINSQKILNTYKEFQDAQKKIDELSRKWQQELLNMQKELQQLNDQFESQSLLLSESKKAEKQQEMQNLYLKMQQFEQEKFAPGQGELYKKREELMAPINEKINKLIEKIGDAENYDFIFDEVVGNILYANKKSKHDLTDRLLLELGNKGASTSK